MDAKTVSRVKRSVIGKKYSALTKEEWDVLFADGKGNLDTVCDHNKIINDSGTVSTALSDSAPPKFKPEPVEKPSPTK